MLSAEFTKSWIVTVKWLLLGPLLYQIVITALIWHFCGRKVTKKMECILKRAPRMARHDYVNDYSTLLIKSGLCSLELQRQKCFAMELFKI